MVAFATLTWSPDDELTSAKLQQHADNESWLKQNCVQAQYTVTYSYVLGANNPSTTNFFGWTPTPSETVTKLVGIYAPFHWDAFATDQVIFQINHPNIFTQYPIRQVSYSSRGQDRADPFIWDDRSPDWTKVALNWADMSKQQVWDGAIHLLLLGL